MGSMPVRALGVLAVWLWFAVPLWWATAGGPRTEDAWSCTESCELGVVVVPLSALVGFAVATLAMQAAAGWVAAQPAIDGALGAVAALAPLAWLAVALAVVNAVAVATRRESSLTPLLIAVVGGALVLAVRRWPSPTAGPMLRAMIAVLVVAAVLGVAGALIGLPGRWIWFGASLAGSAAVSLWLVPGSRRIEAAGRV